MGKHIEYKKYKFGLASQGKSFAIINKPKPNIIPNLLTEEGMKRRDLIWGIVDLENQIKGLSLSTRPSRFKEIAELKVLLRQKQIQYMRLMENERKQRT